MANTTKKSIEEVIREKKAMMYVLEDVLKDLEYRENSLLNTYEKVGEEQRTDSDGNLLYLDEEGNKTTTVTATPSMRGVYEDRTRKVDELDDDEKAKYNALQIVRDTLMNLV